jgi:peptide/nickel transport system substrate-binding protein
MRHALLLIGLTLLAACHAKEKDGPLAVSIIADETTVKKLESGDSMLLATAQGLVRFDGAGQIEPGLAVRWAVSDDGLSYMFRLDTRPGLSSELVARRLRALIISKSNALRPVLGAIDEVVAVTPEVIEIRLRTPRPNLLDLLAQPEMAIAEPRRFGPFHAQPTGPGRLYLVPVEHEEQLAALSKSERRRLEVMVRFENASRAVARFMGGDTAAVLGGRFDTLAVARAANPRARDLRFDPVIGQFGFVIARGGDFLGNPAVRKALAMAIDRDRIAAAIGAPGAQPVSALIPAATIELARPASPDWAAMPLPDRRTAASQAIQSWSQAHKGAAVPILSLALPEGPGGRLLFALVRSDLARIGVGVERADTARDADLRLIDEVAPSGSASWYLRRFQCEWSAVCDAAADSALSIARDTPYPEERAARLGEADARLTAATPFIAIAQPLRWSLVSAALPNFQPNVRGVHPLNHLR